MIMRSDLKDLQERFLSFRLQRALGRLRSPISLMNTGAHPDDEHSALLAYLRFGRGIRIATLSSTRGQGGQNRIGPERGALLGLIRSREMEHAAQVLDADHYWLDQGGDDPLTDFGFSKSGEDSLRRWGGEQAVVERMVRAYRAFRPDIILPTFLDVPGQHGHHRAMTQAALAALPLAADPDYLPDMPIWRISKAYLPAWSGGGATYDDQEPPPPASLIVTAPRHEPLTKASWTQIGEASRLCHATQDMGNPLAPEQNTWPLHLLGGQSENDILQDLPQSYGALSHAPKELSEIDAILADLPEQPSRTLRQAARILRALQPDPAFVSLHGHRVNHLSRALDQAVLLAEGHLPPFIVANKPEYRLGEISLRLSDIELITTDKPLQSYHQIWRALGGNGNCYGILRKQIEGETFQSMLDFQEPPLFVPDAPLAPPMPPVIHPLQSDEVGGLTRIEHPSNLTRQIGYLEGGERVQLLQPLVEKHLSLQLRPAKGRIGYLPGSEDILSLLPHIAEDIIPLTELPPDLGDYDSLLLGAIALARHENLPLRKIKDWVKSGGNLVTFYQRPDQGWPKEGLGLDILHIGTPSLRWRVTQPHAPVTLLCPEHVLFHSPNQITQTDFDGWNKERGLYFASQWGAGYQPLVSLSDPDEPALLGSLLVGAFGNGRHIHLSLTLHHQITALVPGAFRLLANLLHWPKA